MVLGPLYSTQLRSLDLSGCRLVSGRTLAWLSRSCGGLTSLSLASCPLEDADLHLLEPMTTLRCLNLARCLDKETIAGAKRKPAGWAHGQHAALVPATGQIVFGVRFRWVGLMSALLQHRCISLSRHGIAVIA